MGLATQATAYSKVSESMIANLNKIVKGKYAEGGIVKTPQIALPSAISQIITGSQDEKR